MISIEDPLPEDAGEIFFVQRQTWHESYLDQVSHEEIEDRFTDSPNRIKRIREIIETGKEGKYFIARDKEDNKILGVISLLTLPQNKIKSFYVLQISQGKGLGRKLIEKAFEWFGNENIYVETHSDSIQHFYEKFGFEFLKDISKKKEITDKMRLLVRPAGQSTILG